MKTLRAALAIVFIILFSSCATVSRNAPKEFSLINNPEKGLVFFSLTSNLQARNPTQNLYLNYRKKGTSDVSVIPYWLYGIEQDWRNSRLVVLALEPGNYELFRAIFLVIGETLKDDFNMPFIVERGKATYLGQFTGTLQAGANGKRIMLVNNFEQSTRDIDSFESKYPNITTGEINIAGQYLPAR